MPQHNLTVADRRITYEHNDRMVRLNQGIDTIKATFDSEWDSMTSFRVVFVNGKTAINMSMASKSSTVTVPWEVLAEEGMLFIAFIGTSGTKRIVTEQMRYPFMVANAHIEGVSMTAATKDAIQEALDKIAEAVAAADKTNSDIQAAEAKRVTAENGRVSAENTRVSNENTRKSAETSRASAESTRQSNENTRIANENARKSAETGRATAETARANEYGEIVETCKTATTDADDAAARAREAATNASMQANLASQTIAGIQSALADAIANLTGVYIESMSADAIDTLARNVCTSGMLIGGTWYLKPSDWSIDSDGVITLEGSHYRGGGTLELPTRRCVAGDALLLAQTAVDILDRESRLQALRDAQIKALEADNARLFALLSSLALHVDDYPFILDSVIYTRGVTVSGGVVTVPNSKYENGYLKLNPM